MQSSTSNLFLYIFFADSIRAFSLGIQNNQKKTLAPKTGDSVVLLDGVRTPFLMSGTDYNSLMPHELAKHALR